MESVSEVLTDNDYVSAKAGREMKVLRKYIIYR